MADLVSILQTLSLSLPWIQKMIVAFAYTTGMAMIFAAMYKLKQYGELRSMMSMQTDFRGPVTTIMVGTVLIYLPRGLEIMMTSFFGYDSPIAYDADESNRWSQVVSVVIYMTQIVGTAAFIKGWVLISRTVNNQGQHQMMAKAITHILGGLMAINIVGMVELLNKTMGTDIGFSPSMIVTP